MRIVFNTDSLIMGGAEKLALQYINYLSKYFEVELLINEDNGEEGNVLLKKIPENVKFCYVVDSEIIKKLNRCRELKKKNFLYKIPYSYYLKKRRKSYQENIGKILKKIDYDVLIDFYCKIPKEFVDKRTISWLHASLSRIKNKKELMEKFEKVKKVVVITENMKKQFQDHFPDIKNIEVVHNPFNIKRIKELAEDYERITSEDKKLLEDNYIVSCSRLDKNKDIETLILAYENLKDKIKEKLYIIGDGPEREKLEKLVRDKSLEKKVIFLGTKLNPYIWMKNAHLFVHSSKKEGFGMVIVEALINECVVVATDCPVGPSEILENGKYGILTPVGDVQKMEENIFKGLINTSLRDKYKKSAQKRAEKFSNEEIYKKVKEIILSKE